MSLAMRFEWDEAKNKTNIHKHGLDFVDAQEAFEGPLLVRADIRADYGEDRWQGIGMIRGRVVVVVFAEEAPDLIRIISLRKASSEERRLYEEATKNGLGTH